MELEDKRLDQLQYIKTINLKDEMIKELNRRLDENAYLIKVMRRKIGNDFAIVHAGMTTDTEFDEKLVQTDYPANHVQIQAHGFN